MNNLLLDDSRRDKLTGYIGTAVPILIILYTVVSQFIGGIEATLDGFVRNGTSTVLFVMMILLMYGSVYGNQTARLKDTSEAYKDVAKEYEDERKQATMRDYSELDEWLTRMINADAEKARERIISSVMKPSDYAERFGSMTSAQIRRADLPKDVKKVILAARKVKPMRISRRDLLSYSPDGRAKTVYTYEQSKAREIMMTIRTLIPKLIFAVFSVNIVFTVAANGAPEILSVILQTTSLLTTAYSALRNASTKVTVYDVGYVTAKTEILRKFNATEKAASQ